MISKVMPNLRNTNGNMRPLLFFDCLFDIDVGIICYTYLEVLDEEIFDPDKFDMNLIDLVVSLCSRTNKNPLMDFMREPDQTVADEFLNILLNTEESYRQILKYSAITGIYKLLGTFALESDIESLIVISNDIEQEMWDDFVKDVPKYRRIPTIRFEDIRQSTLNGIQQIYCKYTSDLVPLYKKNIEILNKTIYLVRYPFNLVTESGEKNQELDLIGIRNAINSIDLYNIDQLKEEK